MSVAEIAGEPRVDRVAQGEHFVFQDVTWEFYEQVLEQLERAGQHAHVTYDDGRMEIMTTSGWLEDIKKCAARLLEHYSFVRDLPIRGIGSLTLKRKDRQKGVEPDECYYVVKSPVLDKTGHLDLLNGPPPDIAIEVQVSRSSFPKRPVYAGLAVPELWSISEETTEVCELRDGTYVAVATSRFIPKLDPKVFHRFLRAARVNQHQTVKDFDAWLRAAGANQ